MSELTPEQIEAAARESCPHYDEPRGCYRVRCQLGKKCVGPTPQAIATALKGDHE